MGILALPENSVIKIEHPESTFKSFLFSEIQEINVTAAAPETSKLEESSLKLPISTTEV
ncbi:hypothetical protein PCANC_22055 [Puccinia coronata f. sp. avenae]|uniref:Uncharacterized protein n=1 Tax=Puccinia coronata f. sp. avenae TaxID=200324 RepID=A0A2N5TNI0_9BASI|nr:hypothetical protein PCANC_22055 [Puccinia coronata f. sp. avenae]